MNYHAPNVGALSDITSDLMGPSAKLLGKFVASQLEQILTQEDTNNLKSHIDELEKLGVHPNSTDSFRKKKALYDAAIESAAIDPQTDDELAAAWRAALESVLEEDDYNLINIVKQLSSEDVKIIRSMLSEDSYDSNICDRLVNLRIAKRETFKSRRIKMDTLLVFYLLITTGFLFTASELYPYYFKTTPDVDLQRVIQISKWITLFVFITFFLYAIYRNIGLMTSYKLTEYGTKIAMKINKYIDDIHSTQRAR